MSRVAINTGSVGNDGTGDSLRTAGGIINDNFAEIYSQFGDGTNLTPTWDKTAAGVNTTSNVGIGTTNPRFALEVGSVGSSGTSLFVNGNARVTGILTVGSSSIILDGNTNKILVGSGISFDGNTGVISATAFYAGGSIVSASGESYWDQTEVGIHTLSNVGIGTTNPTSALTVKGNTSLETLSVSGVSTFSGDIKFSGTYGDNGALWDESEGALIFKDGREIRFGDYDGSGGDLRIYHDAGGSHSYIQDTGTGNLRIISNGDSIELLKDTSETMAKFNTDESVELYYDNSKKFETLGTGVTVTGTTFTNDLNVSGVSTFSGNLRTNNSNIKLGDGTEGTGNQIKLGNGVSPDAFGDTSDFWIYHNPGYGNLLQDITGAGVEVWTGEFKVANPSNPSENVFYTIMNAGTELYYDRNKKFETLGAGVTVTGTTFTNQLNVSGVSTFSGATEFSGTTNLISGINKLNFNTNTGQEGQLWANSDYFYINSSATYGIVIQGNTLVLRSASAGENYLTASINNGVLLYHDDVKKFETIGAGVTVTGTTFTNQLNVSGISTLNSLLISNDGGNNGSVLIEDVGSYSQLTFRASNGTNQSKIQGVESTLNITSGSSGHVALNTYSIFQPNGDVVLNNGFVGTTRICNEVYVRPGITTIGDVQVSSGIITASADSSSGIVTYYGDTSNTAVGRWILGANETSDYTFTGIGFTQTTNNPVLYLARGMVYEFVNNSGGAHPFEIRVSNGGAAYSDGVTNNAAATGVIRFEIPFNAPNTLYYQCTVHSGMGNTISVYPNTI